MGDLVQSRSQSCYRQNPEGEEEMEIEAEGMGAEEEGVGIEAEWIGAEVKGMGVETFAEGIVDSGDHPALGPTKRMRQID